MKGQTWAYPNIENPTPGGLTKHRFKRQHSLLDDYHHDSKMRTSDFRGIFNLLSILVIFFLVVRPINHHFEMGTFASWTLFDNIRNEFFSCMLIWPLFSLWSFSAFALEKLHVMGYNGRVLRTLKHCSQCVIFVFGIITVATKDWPLSHQSFVVLQMFVHFMKMHSYTNTNRDYRRQAKEAKAKGEKPLSNYPANVNLKNFAHFMLIPVLVYEESYPLLERRDYKYLAKTIINFWVCFLAMYLISTDYIIPFVEQGDKISIFQLLSRSIMPVTIFLILLFYIVFDCICNIFAELALFADRGFYHDWWNSTTFEEYNRLWNQPVHEFLYRHVYLEAIMRFQLSKGAAQFLTFLFSALLHELLCAVMFKTFRPILFIFMLGQIPLFWMTKTLKHTKLGNYVFWFGLTFGPSLIICLYLRSDARVTTFYQSQDLL